MAGKSKTEMVIDCRSSSKILVSPSAPSIELKMAGMAVEAAKNNDAASARSRSSRLN